MCNIKAYTLVKKKTPRPFICKDPLPIEAYRVAVVPSSQGPWSLKLKNLPIANFFTNELKSNLYIRNKSV